MSLTLLLRCNDIEETREFYETVLGFNVSETAGTLTAERSRAKLVFTQQDLWRSLPVCSGTIYFTVSDADSYFASLQDRVSVAWPAQDRPHGSREFGINDCNGYYLAFQQHVSFKP
ncbi:VOC family protein [Noviherbaspirillum saxi]|uniref:Bleomycin resistance family protein n=1 Tax=Noviherbaspirillum saxi TaxID=2320863 RepID=A0A3A3FKU1_9BURK|nr:VOC family protein [Noviherbaspirillum saxi]RJF95341.1 bleomycin resistance family protein [Noviherbaspirillum saxi]